MQRFAVPVLFLLAAGSAVAGPLKPSFAEQLKLGLKAAADIRQKEKVLPASDYRVKKLRELGALVAKQIPADELKKKPYQFTFDVIESKEVNAFCLPGGPVFFYTGLLDKLTTEDQVLGILGHEVAHARNEHWARATEDQLNKTVGLTILLGALKANDIWYKAGDAALTLDMLKYSRKNETQSDDGGYAVVTGAGYNPQGMIDVFEMFRKLKAGGGGPEWLASHPDDKNRIKRLQDAMTKSKAMFPAQRQFAWMQPVKR